MLKEGLGGIARPDAQAHVVATKQYGHGVTILTRARPSDGFYLAIFENDVRAAAFARRLTEQSVAYVAFTDSLPPGFNVRLPEGSHDPNRWWADPHTFLAQYQVRQPSHA